MTTHPVMKTVQGISWALMFLAWGGCAQLQLSSRDPMSKVPKASDRNPVKEVICLWEPAEGTGLDGKPCRGFAGQLLFFSTASEAPAIVNGTVEIYVFDDQGTDEEQAKPIDTFTFTPDQWELFMRPNNSLGATYQLFVPYSRKGAHQAVCTLRVKYTPPDNAGVPIYSRMASVLLAGKVSKSSTKTSELTSTSAQKSSAAPGQNAAVPPASFQELKRIAQASYQSPESTGSVVPAIATETVSSGPDERQRLRQRLAQVLKEGESDPEQIPWKPEARTIRPQAITPAGGQPPVHPLDSL